MDKAKLIGYLDEKLQQTDDENLNFETWKHGILRMLDQALGKNNPLSRQVQGLELIETMSYEELYPKKVVDWDATRGSMKAVLQEVIEELKFMDEVGMATAADGGEAEVIIQSIRKALHNNLSGHQLNMVRQKATVAKKEGRQEGVKSVLEDFDIEVVRAILSEILSTPEFWEREANP